MLHCNYSYIDITPDKNLFLAGFANRRDLSSGIHHPLRSQCLILESDGVQFCLIVNDFMETERELVKKIRQAITEKTSIPFSHIFIHSIHTHSAPIMDGMGLPLHKANLEYQAKTTDAIIANAIATANDKKGFQLCYLSVGRGSAFIGANRRYLDPQTGKMTISTEGNIPGDSTLSVLQFSDAQGMPIVSLFNYACHPVSLGDKNLLASPDFVGQARKEIENKWGGGAIFLNGAAGDINPIGDTGNDLKRTDTFGKALSDAVLSCSFERVKSEKMTVQAGSVDLPFKVQDLTSDYIQSEVIRKSAEGTDFLSWKERVELWGKHQKFRLSQGNHKSRHVEIAALKIGQVVLFLSQGELFSSYHKRLRNIFPEQVILLAGYINGETGYLPDKEAFSQGGYEVEQAYIYFNEPSPLHPQSDELFTKAAIELIKAL